MTSSHAARIAVMMFAIDLALEQAMTEAFDVAQWAKNWEALSRQYQSAFGGTPPVAPWSMPANPFAGSWADGFAQAMPSGATSAQASMQAAAQGYLTMLQGMAAAAAQQGNAPANPFAEAMKNVPGFGGFDAGMANNPFASAMRGVGNQVNPGFEQIMQRFAAAAGPMFDQGKASLAFPAFGPMREKQEQMQKSAARWIDFQEQNARYNRLMLKVSEHAAARFQLKLAEREEPGRQVDSVKGLYDLWVDAYEEAYAEIALSQEYREIYGALIDAQMRVRENMQAEIERICVELGMPTRSEVDTIGERLQALRREYRNDREEAGDTESLKAEIAALRSEMESLKRAKPAPDATNVVKFPQRAAAIAEHAGKPAVAIPVAGTAPPTRRIPAANKAKKSAAKQRKPRSAASKTSPTKATAKKSAQSFAASIARFARKTKSDSVAAPVKPARSKLSKR